MDRVLCIDFQFISFYTSAHFLTCHPNFFIFFFTVMLNNSCALLLLSIRGLLLCSICEVVSTSTNGFMIYSFCISAESEPTTLSTAVSVGITAVVIATIVLIVGFLAGVLVYHCINKHQTQNSKPETSSHQQQQATVLQQRAGPEYEEVVELKENMAYVPAQSIELKACEAYVPVQH